MVDGRASMCLCADAKTTGKTVMWIAAGVGLLLVLEFLGLCVFVATRPDDDHPRHGYYL
jgi:hypothetical protein